MLEKLLDFYAQFFGADVTVAPEYLLISLGIAFVVYRIARARGTVNRIAPAEGGFWHWLTPRAIWRHRSTRLDVVLFVIGRLMSTAGVFARITLTTAVAVAVAPVAQSVLGPTAPETARLAPLPLALCLWLASDFGVYWVHRAFHTIGRIWPLHAVHHSAEVMTPVTTYRQHPLALVLSTIVVSVVIGLVQGIVVGSLAPTTLMTTVASVNVFTALANFTVSNFHHTHLWIGFPPWLERLVISPAQHQIHHSTRPEHYNRNYGNILAVWDWLFGTLHLSQGETQPRVGLTGATEAPLMTHGLWAVLWTPVRRVFWR